jgi:hypothetical protein
MNARDLVRKMRKISREFCAGIRHDSPLNVVGILRDCGAKKSHRAGREGLARSVGSLLRWSGSMGG